MEINSTIAYVVIVVLILLILWLISYYKLVPDINRKSSGNDGSLMKQGVVEGNIPRKKVHFAQESITEAVDRVRKDITFIINNKGVYIANAGLFYKQFLVGSYQDNVKNDADRTRANDGANKIVHLADVVPVLEEFQKGRYIHDQEVLLAFMKGVAHRSHVYRKRFVTRDGIHVEGGRP